MDFKEFFCLPLPAHFGETGKDAAQSAVLFEKVFFSDEDLQNLLFTWCVRDGMPLTDMPQPVDLGGYRAYVYGESLYLLDTEFATENLTALLQKLDDVNDPLVVSRIVVLGQHFASKALRELGEAVSYPSKKSSRYSLIVRYGLED